MMQALVLDPVYTCIIARRQILSSSSSNANGVLHVTEYSSAKFHLWRIPLHTSSLQGRPLFPWHKAPTVLGRSTVCDGSPSRLKEIAFSGCALVRGFRLQFCDRVARVFSAIVTSLSFVFHVIVVFWVNSAFHDTLGYIEGESDLDGPTPDGPTAHLCTNPRFVSSLALVKHKSHW